MQQPQHRDTVRVVVPQVVDSVKVRIGATPRDTAGVQVPGTLRAVVRVPDSLRATTRQVGFDPYAFSNVVLAAALIGVTIWAHRRTHAVEEKSSALQQQNVDLQAKYVELQREFNETQVRHEKERRDAEREREEERRRVERQRAEEQRRATDARLSGTAFALRRQLISWTDQAPEEVKTLVDVADAFREEYKKKAPPGSPPPRYVPGLPDNVLEATMMWAHRLQKHFDSAEARMLELVAAAPDGTTKVAESLRRVCVLFFQATSRLNQQVAAFAELHVANESELAIAYHELEQCALELGIAIGAELLIASEIIARKDWLPE